MRDHTKLRAFVLADEVAMRTYRETRDFPKEEVYGLTAQMRRAAVSVPSNIVEGCSRESEAEFLRFLDIAFGKTAIGAVIGVHRMRPHPGQAVGLQFEADRERVC